MIKTVNGLRLNDLQKQTLRGIKQRLQSDDVYYVSNDNEYIYMDITGSIRIKFDCDWSVYDNIVMYGEVIYRPEYGYDNEKYILNLNKIVVGNFDNSYDSSSYDSECGYSIEEDEKYHYEYTSKGNDGFGNYLEAITYECQRMDNSIYREIIECIDNMLKGVE